MAMVDLLSMHLMATVSLTPFAPGPKDSALYTTANDPEPNLQTLLFSRSFWGIVRVRILI